MSTQRRPVDRRNADLARIHIARKWASDALGMSEGDYRTLVGQICDETGADVPAGRDPSAAFLSEHGRSALLGAFGALGWPDARQSERPAAPRPRVKGQTNGRYPVAGNTRAGGMISQRQADYIAHLEDLLDWTDDATRLTGWISHQLDAKLSFVAALTKAETTVVITGLEVLAGIKRSGSKASRGSRWGQAARKTASDAA